MFCYNCGAECADDMQFCPNCGTKLVKFSENKTESNNHSEQSFEPKPPVNQVLFNEPQGMSPKSPLMSGNGFAIASLVLGICSFFIAPLVTGLLAVIFGGVAKSKGHTGSFSTAGMVCGILGIVGWILITCILAPIVTELLEDMINAYSSTYY